MSRLAELLPAGADPTGGDIPLAATVARALADPSTEAIAIGPVVDEAVEHRLLDLLTGDFGIGAVVPKVVSPGGVLREAGAVFDAGRLTPRGAGGRVDEPEHSSSRDVDGTAYAQVAVGRAVAAEALRTLPPTEHDPSRVTAALLSAARSMNRRVVFEPAWTVASEAAQVPVAPAEAAPEMGLTPTMPPPAILVVAGFVPGEGPGAESGGARLLASLSEVCDPGTISVLALDAFGARHRIDRLRAQGFEVTSPPFDLGAWFEGRWGQFSHAFVCQSARSSTIRYHLHRTQPQAARIAYLESLQFHHIEAWRPVTPAPEAAGLETAATAAVGRAADLAMWADSVWCERSSDAALLSGLVAGRRILTIRPGLEDPVAPSPFGSRSGIVVSAAGGHEVSSGNEESAMQVIEQILPALRRRDPALTLKVISDDPTPMLERAAAEVGATFVPTEEAPAALDQARLLMALHSFGTGGGAAVLGAIAASTPFVASPQAVAGLELGGVATLGVFGLHADIVNAAWQLLTDKEHWSRFDQAVDALRRSTYDPVARSTTVSAALASLGVVPAGRLRRWPAARDTGESGRRRRRLEVPIRPEGFRNRQPAEVPHDLDERKIYAMWCERYGPTPEALDAFRSEMDRLDYKPTISVVMPVYNTDPDVLTKAIESVRTQVYDRWQLCIADDGSTRRETLAVLEEYRSDPAISIVHLAGNSGISGATNAALVAAHGDYVAFLDHDDLYKPHALAQVVRWLNADPSLDLIYSDEDKVDETEVPRDPHIKPDWSPDHLMSNNYVCHLTVVRRSLLEQAGRLRSELDGSQDYDVILRVSELTDRIAHIPEPLYSWRIIAGSAAADPTAKPYAWKAGKRALEDALRRRGYPGEVDYTANPGIYRSRYRLPGQPKVAIIIPTRDRVDLLRSCIDSIANVTTYRNFELVVVDNQSQDAATLGYLAHLPGQVIRYPHRFNYARMMNLAAASVECDALLFLNNDTRVTSPEWIEAMVEHAMRPEIGAVGGRLYFEDGRVQHEGIFLGVVGLAANAHYNGYWGRGDFIRNTSAVTGACMMVRPTVYWHVGGNDERLRMAYNDVDLCLRIRQAGLEIVYTPYAELVHVESASRSYEHAEDEDDAPLFDRRWRPRESVDPYYSPMFVRDWPFLIAV